MGKQKGTKVRLIRSVYTSPDGERAKVYGIRVYLSDGVWEFADIDPDAAVVRELIARMRSLTIERCHLSDIVADYIEELACGWSSL